MKRLLARTLSSLKLELKTDYFPLCFLNEIESGLETLDSPDQQDAQ